MAIPKKQVLIGATDVKFETTFSGQQPLSAKWMNGETQLATNSDYTVVDDVTAANSPYTLSLTIKTVSDSTPTSFKVVVNMQPPCNDLFTSNEYTQTATLEPLSKFVCRFVFLFRFSSSTVLSVEYMHVRSLSSKARSINFSNYYQ